MSTHPSDDDLLTSADPEAFGVFFARHHQGVLAYFSRRVGAGPAADLAAETFASALVARRRFVPSDTPAIGWLYAIAARRLIDWQRRSHVQLRLRETLIATHPHHPVLASELDDLDTELDAGLLRHLAAEQRNALLARFVEDRSYRDIAEAAGTSEATIRQRISRGLGVLRRPLQVYRAAQDLARQDRDYRFGGGHGKSLDAISGREALDCSAAASLALFNAGVFPFEAALPSGQLASDWGEPGEGRYVTVWADDADVYLEFKLDADHRERFDPTPSRLAPHSRWLRRAAHPGTRELTPRHWPGL